VVFPDAVLKVFVTASVDERARRRSRQTGEDLEAVRAALHERDGRDAGRPDDPLAQADDALVVDTSARSVDDVVDELCRHLEART
jgi:cytidylate kinase